MKSKSRSVLVYNPISGHGHLDSWLEIFVQILIEQKFCVFVLTPDPDELHQKIVQKGQNKCFHILPWDCVRFRKPFLRHFRDWWVQFGGRYFYGREGSVITPEMPFLIRVKKTIYRMLIPSMFVISKKLWKLIRKNHAKSDVSEDTGLDPVEMGLRIKDGLKKLKDQPEFLFVMYMDMYQIGIEPWNQFASICKLPWGGIRFVPNASPVEGYYSLANLRGMCFLDEKVSRSYSKLIPHKIFPFIPDITNSDLTSEPPDLLKKILEKAKGRKIVFLGGSIGGQKNIARWVDVISISDPEKWFFVQVGEIHANTFTREDTEAFQRLCLSCRENVYILKQFIKNEADFNSLIKASDILYAVYRDFRISSNMLGKSAFFEVPILVSDKFLMGERVRNYGIGLAVNENDSVDILKGMEQLIQAPVHSERFQSYRNDFSVEKLWSNIASLFRQSE